MRAVGTVIDTDKAPSALGPYSQAVKAGQTLYISGQIGFDPKTMEFAGEGVKEQAEQVHPLWHRKMAPRRQPSALTGNYFCSRRAASASP